MTPDSVNVRMIITAVCAICGDRLTWPIVAGNIRPAWCQSIPICSRLTCQQAADRALA